MSGTQIGEVTHYFDHINVAALALTESLRVGDTAHILGHSTDLRQEVTSLQINHQPVTEAGPDDDVGMKVIQKVHPHDKIFKLMDEQYGDHAIPKKRQFRDPEGATTADYPAGRCQSYSHTHPLLESQTMPGEQHI